MMTYNNHLKRGFTLIELSIVLVIIGLLVGGILAGRELIEQSKIRRQVAQINEFSKALGAFQMKYNGLPGDLQRLKAKAFGLTWINYTSIGGGDEMIEDSTHAQPPQDLVGDNYYAFIQLSDAGLIPGKYISVGNTFSIGEDGNQFPSAAIGTGGFIMLSYQGKVNILSLSTSTTAPNFYMWTNSNFGIFSPKQAYQIDQKLDDGVPSTGIVRAVKTNFSNDNTANSCSLTTAATDYNISSDVTTLCRLLIQL